MNWWQAFLLGVVQGFTEFLPISSSGHLVLMQHYMGLDEPSIFFSIFLHVMTLVVVTAYFSRLLLKLSMIQIRNIVVASIPVAIVGVVWGSEVTAVFESVRVVSVILLVTGLANLISDRLLAKQDPDQAKTEISVVDAVIIGLAQTLAIMPGLSRSGSTMLAGLSRKISRQEVFAFSFIISIPVIGGAMAVEVIKTGLTIPEGLAVSHFILGGIGAILSGWLSLVVLERFLKTAQLHWFGWYCMVVGMISLVVSW